MASTDGTPANPTPLDSQETRTAFDAGHSDPRSPEDSLLSRDASVALLNDDDNPFVSSHTVPRSDTAFAFDDIDDSHYANDLPPSSYDVGDPDTDSDSELPVEVSEHLSAGMEFGWQIRSTPRTLDGTRQNTKGQTVKVQRKFLLKALGVVTETDPDYVDVKFTIPQSVDFPQLRITEWLENQASALGIFDPDTYSWCIPEQPTSEHQLYDYYVAIISAILNEFVTPPGTGVEREIVDVHDEMFSHIDVNRKTSPDLVIRATGSSFENPSNGKDIGYANIATVIDAKLDDQISKNVHLEQLASYIQQIFAHQPNRLYVDCLLVSEKRIRLVHFDRSGAEIVPLISLIERPDMLVRLIIGLCSTNERDIGLDTSIQWNIVNGKKKSGTMKTVGPDGQEKTYALAKQHPIAQDYDIRGRGTTFWAVRDPETKKKYLVKQSWTSDGRPLEHLHLLRAQAIPGVCEMVGHEVREEIRDFRCDTTEFSNRTALRITMKIYGQQVDKFKTVLQALHAVRDAIAAHEMLWRRKLLHRDVSNKNILLGHKDAIKGWRGVLIDLGVALDFQDDTNCNITKEARSGSRFFQSCIILEYLTRVSVGDAPAHDYLDDLECFFYVLCFLFFLFLPDGTERGDKDIAKDIVKDWDSETAETALAPKSLLFNPARGQRDFAANIVAETWGPACETLFTGLLEWLCKIQQEKATLLRESRRKVPENRAAGQSASGSDTAGQQSRTSENPMVRGVFAPLLLQSDRHYAEVISLFEIAIAAIETSPAQGAPPRAALEKRGLFNTASAGPSKSSRTSSVSRPTRSQQA